MKPKPDKERLPKTYLVAYPKSGSTWLRFILANLLYDSPCDFANVRIRVPDLHDREIDPALFELAPVVKSHFSYRSEYSKVLLVVRDPRDVAVSYYYHHLKHGLIKHNHTMEEFVGMLNTGDLYPGCTWQEHTESWLNQGCTDIAIVKYEDLHKNPLPTLQRILGFLRWEHNERAVRNALDRSDFKAMRHIEEKQHASIPSLSTSREDIRHVRKGIVGSWTNELDRRAAQALEEVNADCMLRLGYLEAVDGRSGSP